MNQLPRFIKISLALLVAGAIGCVVCLVLSLPIYIVCVLWNNLLGWI